jgi:hypothetical protein
VPRPQSAPAPYVVVNQPTAGQTASNTLVVLGVVLGVFVGLPLLAVVVLPLLLLTSPFWFPAWAVSNGLSLIVAAGVFIWDWAEDKA